MYIVLSSFSAACNIYSCETVLLCFLILFCVFFYSVVFVLKMICVLKCLTNKAKFSNTNYSTENKKKQKKNFENTENKKSLWPDLTNAIHTYIAAQWEKPKT